VSNYCDYNSSKKLPHIIYEQTSDTTIKVRNQLLNINLQNKNIKQTHTKPTKVVN